MTDKPPVNTPENPVLIDPKRILCPGHGEHLRAEWPKGYAIVGMGLFQAAVANPTLIRELDPEWDGEDGHAQFDPEQLNALTERKPLCYFVDDDTLRRLFREAGIFETRRCDLCGVPGDAGPYSMRLHGDRVETKIVCLECALKTGARMHAAFPEGVWTEEGP